MSGSKFHNLRNYNDVVLPALMAAKRRPQLRSHFKLVLAKSPLFILLNDDRRTSRVTLDFDGEIKEYAGCFTSSKIAELSWAKISGLNRRV